MAQADKREAKAKGSGFQCNRYLCGVRDQSRSRAARGRSMRTKSGTRGVLSNNTEDVKPQESPDLESVEHSWKTLCSLEENRFGSLLEDDQGDEQVMLEEKDLGNGMTPPGL